MNGNIPSESQEGRVLDVLREAKGDWINKQYFVRTMMLTQAGRAIYNLENEPKWKAEYEGYKIEHSDFRDQWGFKSFRLVKLGQQKLL